MNNEAQLSSLPVQQKETNSAEQNGQVARVLARIEPAAGEAPGPQWRLATSVAFRFCFVYFGLYCLATQIFTSMFPIPKVDIPDLGTLTPLRQLVFWIAAHVFRIKSQLVYQGSGSGDKVFDWVQFFCFLMIAAITTAAWSALDRQRENYVTLHKWFHLFLRFALAGQMLVYGLSKLVPLQMPFPFLTSLLEPYGRFSPMGVLWSSIGASPAYETFAGCAETLGGLLLIFPRTTLFGALICLADMTEVFMLNMTYDVPVKLLSFHLILMSLFLLTPDFPRLASFFFLNRTAPPSEQPLLFRSPRRNRMALLAQVVLGAWLVGTGIYGSWDAWHQFGPGRDKSALYGIWDIEEMSIAGQIRSPLLNDYDRWRRAIFDFSTFVSFQRMDDSFASYSVVFEKDQKTLTISRSGDKAWKASLVYEHSGPDQLTLDGEIDGRKTHMRLHRVDHTKFPLLSRGFHWIQDYPFNR